MSELAAGLRDVVWTPDDTGIVALLDSSEVVYLPADAPEQVYRLGQAEHVQLPPSWPIAP